MREKKPINIYIGNQIRIARERAGLTQEQFGELVCLGTKNVSDIERGVAGITVSTLKRICEKLSISSDSILFGSQEKNDVFYLTERLERLSPEQFEAVEAFLNHIFTLYGRLEGK
ncbi:MAG: helix-turn-helix transcriptional regulator [Eubacteriales bacterium]|nr:helix-turn-helix transcriptional regulator [Eubacteriales bacterium]